MYLETISCDENNDECNATLTFMTQEVVGTNNAMQLTFHQFLRQEDVETWLIIVTICQNV